MADPFPFRAGLPPETTMTVKLYAASGDPKDVNCGCCLREKPEWEFRFREPITAASVTAGLCEQCRRKLVEGR